MNAQHSPNRQTNAPVGASVADRASKIEGAAQIVIMLAIGCAAGAASFTHVHNVAAAHGQTGWLAWADAVVLELMSIASGLELRRRRRCGKPVGFPATVLVCAVLLSIAAQVVEAEPSVIGWIAAALPALGFLAMVKIALGRSHSEPTPAQREAFQISPGHQQVPVTGGQPVADTATPVPDRTPTAAKACPGQVRDITPAGHGQISGPA